MKPFLIAVAMALMAVFAQAQPKMNLSHLDHNFGSIGEKSPPVSHSFELRNAGDQPLVILRTETGCNCTSATYSKRPIAPGASSEIVITYNPKGQKGEFLKAIQVFTNEPVKRQIISVQGRVAK